MGSLAQCHSRLSLDKKITAVFGQAFATLAVAGVPTADYRKAATFPAQVENAHVLRGIVMKPPRKILLPFFHATRCLTLRGIGGSWIRRREAMAYLRAFALPVAKIQMLLRFRIKSVSHFDIPEYLSVNSQPARARDRQQVGQTEFFMASLGHDCGAESRLARTK
jgi:hypothetical protein